MKHVIQRIVGCAIVILILILISNGSILKLIEGPTDLSKLSLDNLPNAYVKGDINEIIGVFAEYYVTNEDGTEDITDKYYVLPVGDYEYIGLKINEDDFDLADQIYDETYEYYEQTRTELTTNMHITGTIIKMDDEANGFYDDWFQESGLAADYTTEELENIAIPYILQVNYIGEHDSDVVNLLIFIICIVLLYGVIILIKGLSGSYISQINKYIKQNYSEYNSERLDVEYQSATQIESVRVCQSCTFFFNGNKAHIIKNDDIIWAYLQEVTHRVYGFKTRVSRTITIFTKDKKKHLIPMNKSDHANAIIASLSQVNPKIVTGYSDDLKKCYKKDYDTFLKLSSMRESYDSEQSVEHNL